MDDLVEEKEEREGVLEGITNLTIETEGTNVEAAEQLKTSLQMEVEEDRGERGRRRGWGDSKDTGIP